jgi:hypothetical protein
MIEDTDIKRNQMIQRLTEAGFKPPAIDQIVPMIDAMMTGHSVLAYVMVAAAEVCTACELSRTHKHVADALDCLAAETLQFEKATVDSRSDGPGFTQSGIAHWNHKRRGRVEKALA